MKIDIPERLLKFPRVIPNDLEGLIFLYPDKFPPIISEFEAIVPTIASDPVAFRAYGDKSREELGAAFEKIKHDYENGDDTDLDFLISIDERFSKIYCYRFWIVNYLLPDGPIHDYIVDTLKDLIRKFVDMTEDIEDFEQKVVRIQRDLLQSDYADLYLKQALEGVKSLELLEKNDKIAALLPSVITLIDEHKHENTPKINEVWNQVYDIIKNDDNTQELQGAMAVALSQVEMRSSTLPLYNMLTHAVEFREENIRLTQRHKDIGGIIDEYKKHAQEILDPEEYGLFILCYEQARNFTMYKDIMGTIDEVLLPTWFGLHAKIKKILLDSGEVIRQRPTGPTAVCAHFVWYLPPHLKDKAMTADLVPFDLETI
jgi:hypothetical protein